MIFAHIARHSIAEWGTARAEAYLRDFDMAFDRLAAFPFLGRDASQIRAGYRRAEHGLHSIFYVRRGKGILIVRVLHQGMDPDGRL